MFHTHALIPDSEKRSKRDCIANALAKFNAAVLTSVNEVGNPKPRSDLEG